MLLSNWTPELLNDILSSLDPQHRLLLEIHVRFSDIKKGRSPSLSFLKTHGLDFKTIEEYEAASEAAFFAIREAFADRALFSVNDLEFEEPKRTLEGRMQGKPSDRFKTKKTEDTEP
jgi:hypothetical protein